MKRKKEKKEKKRAPYESALENYDQSELIQMDKALIGITNEMLR